MTVYRNTIAATLVLLLVAPAAVSAQSTTPADQTAPAPSSSPPPRQHAKGDPLEGFNRDLFSVHTALDKALFRPLALGAGKVVPKPVRSGLNNFLRNLSEPIVLLNDLLQLRFKKAGRTFTRFFVNSTLGIGGLIDLAKKEGVPREPNGFGNTLAKYGVGPGPYLFLPLVGPTNFRDLAGGQADGLVLPLAVGKPFSRIEYIAGRTLILGIEQRRELDREYQALIDGAADPYATFRSVFLQNRAAEVAALRGKSDTLQPGELDDPLTDPLADPAPDSPTDPAADPAADPVIDPAADQPADAPAEPPLTLGTVATPADQSPAFPPGC